MILDPRCAKGAPGRPVFRGRDADPKNIEGKPVDLDLGDTATRPQRLHDPLLEQSYTNAIPYNDTHA